MVGVVWYGMVWYCMVWYDVVRYCMVWYDMVWCVVWCGVVWCGALSGRVYDGDAMVIKAKRNEADSITPVKSYTHIARFVSF